MVDAAHGVGLSDGNAEAGEVVAGNKTAFCQEPLMARK